MRTTKRSISSATLGQPTRWRNLDPLNLFAMRLRYQPRIVSGCAADATFLFPPLNRIAFDIAGICCYVYVLVQLWKRL